MGGLGCQHEKELCSVLLWGTWDCSKDGFVAVYSPVKCSWVAWEVEEGSNDQEVNEVDNHGGWVVAYDG